MTAMKAIQRTLLASVLMVQCVTGSAFAQEVSWTDPGPLGAGQHATLDLVFEDTQPYGAVRLPAIDGLTVLGSASQGSRVSIVNGQRSASVTLSYHVRAEREGHIDVPPFVVNTSDGQHPVPGLRLEVGPAMLAGKGQQRGTPVSDAVTARMLPSTKQPYAGQVFNVDVVVAVHDGQRGEVVGAPEWERPGVEVESWSKGQPVSSAGSSAVRFRTRVVAPKVGTVTLPAAQQEVRIENSRWRSRDADDFFSMPQFSKRGFSMSDLSDFFSQSSMSDVTAATEPVELQVQPLPQPVPAGFSGAVGDFALESKIVPQEPQTGEPVTWTLRLKGTGNWSDVHLPARAIPGGMRVLQPQQHRDFTENDLFTGSISEDLVLIPNRAGELHLDPVRFMYFNPRTQQYETASAQPPVLAVAPSALPMQQGSNIPRAAAASAPVAAPAPLAAAASSGAALPHDPLSGTGTAWVPVNGRRLTTLCALPFFVLAAYWLMLAARRARQTDPRRFQREALARLGGAISYARRASDPEQRRRAVLAWQRAVATVLGLPVAAPTAAHVRSVRVESPLADTIDQWLELWAESERVLYSRDATIAEWWYERAITLRSRIRLPRLNPLRAFLPRNLLPLTAAAGVVLVCAAAAYADALDEYRQGNFTVARQQFATRAAANPSDWTARYNLGLAAAQLGENGRALGETAAAFALHPQSAAVRWNLRVFAARRPGLDATLAHVAFAPGVAAVARAVSPARWQTVLIAGCILLCAGGALTLRHRYQGCGRTSWQAPRRHAAHALAIGGAAGVLVALLALQQYGPLANQNAAVVAREAVLRSVPTEAATAQQQASLAIGSVVLMQKDFLGWVRIVRPTGETGWLRGGDVVPLYGASPTV